MGWWCGGPTAIIDIPMFLCYGTAPGTALAVCFFLYIAWDKFTPGTVSAYMQGYWRRIGAVCSFVFVPVLVRGSIRTMVVYGVMVCWCVGVFPAVWCVSRRRSVWFTFLYGAFVVCLLPVVFQAAPGSRRSCSFMVATVPRFAFCCPGGVLSFRRVLLRSGLLSYYHSTTL